MASMNDVNNEFAGDIELTDLVVIVEGRKILVSKSVLCIASPVFYAMFKGDFQEKTMTEIPLPGKKYEDFVEFLRCIYPDRLKKVTVKNAYQVLPLAHEYQVKKIQQRCEKVICKIVRENHINDVPELYRHILMAETFSLDDLKETCTYIASEHKLEQFEEAFEKYRISADSHFKVIKLALRRRELNSEDDEYLSINVNGELVRENASDHSRYKRAENDIRLVLSRNIREIDANAKDSLRALRLAKRFHIKQNNIRSIFMKRLNRTEDWSEELKEEFKLLPEIIKQIEVKK